MNNKGMTIVEVLISIVIIGVVIAFLFNLFIDVRYEDLKTNAQSNFIINQSTFIKEIEADIFDYEISKVEKCNILDVGVQDYMIHKDVNGNSSYRCIKITYQNGLLTDNIGALMVFDYNTVYKKNGSGWAEDAKDGSHAWYIAYKRGYERGDGEDKEFIATKTLMREIPEEIDLTVDESNTSMEYLKDNDTYIGRIIMPIIDLNGSRYDIDLSFRNKKIDNSSICITSQVVGDSPEGSFKCTLKQ